MNTTFLLIRHGEVEYEYSDTGEKLIYTPKTPLSDLGTKQTKSTVLELFRRGFRPSSIYTSPYVRARQSAEIAAEMFKIDKKSISEESLLCDVNAPGWWGRTFRELESIGGNIYAALARSGDQDSISDLIRKGKNAVRNIVEGNPRKTVLAVSHGDKIAAINFALLYPDAPDPSYEKLVEAGYPDEKGTVWKYIFNPELEIVGEVEVIRGRGPYWTDNEGEWRGRSR